ncbi:MAG: SDR family oxidoreductase [Bacteroidales bacterium]|nr:SDR family oxidoreductase [Bacteroidales bacterium]
MNYTLITGASSGIGYELALRFAENGHNVILIARNEEKLKQASDRLENIFNIKTLILPVDLSQPDAADEIYRKVAENQISVNYLVNNAGFYVKGSFSETSWEEEQKLILLQCLNHSRLIKLFLPGMISRGKGGILNIGSTGSFVPGPYNAVYCAVKSFVLSLSQAVAEEVSGKGVTVTALCPGGTKTGFCKSTERKSSFLFPMLDASLVAKAGYRGLMKGKRIVIPGKMDRLNVFLTRFLPARLVIRTAGRMMRDH